MALQAELGAALQFAERAVRRGNIALQRHDTLVDRVQNPAGLREVFLLVFGGGADPVVGADDGQRGIQIVEAELRQVGSDVVHRIAAFDGFVDQHALARLLP